VIVLQFYAVSRCRYYIPHPWVPAYQGVITLFVIANFTLATFMDPGVIPRGNYVSYFWKTKWIICLPLHNSCTLLCYFD